jgi:hypothetical protein
LLWKFKIILIPIHSRKYDAFWLKGVDNFIYQSKHGVKDLTNNWNISGRIRHVEVWIIFLYELKLGGKVFKGEILFQC